ncbi:gephyrin-like molybdotransferase Glp [Geobacter sp. AOG1]|uniref:molybdopterin molybdotransferase MoeA n=1 Tax=Geobacter sp. AOG1 TaxID=1566346 RepID=UPI001CC500A9|nr:gephyrin-like molybdotransferase Glp [Geobacter sp. AOG1]GFE57383.1 molybdopterin molybdenumtransferase MoeA [Geobacter sp. AOG1]
MIPIEEARQLVLRHTGLLGSEDVPLLQGLGRVVAEDVVAPWNIPLTDSSAMDGYAFSASAGHGKCLRVVGFLPAGERRDIPLAAGEAVRIMTGAPLPPGCDTVVPIEEVEETVEGIRLRGEAKAGTHVRKAGDDVRSGDYVIEAGTTLRPQEIGLLASLGKVSVSVYGVPSVAIIATGDELVESDTQPVPGKTINSNSLSLAAQVLACGGRPHILGIAADERKTVCEKIDEALQYDVIITTGGVSVGDRDHVKEAIQSLGGKIVFWKVHMKPGKPVAFALLKGKPVFALPGNPVSAMVAGELFVRPALLTMRGVRNVSRPVVKATASEGFRNAGERPHVVFVSAALNEGKYVVGATGRQSSSRLSSMTAGNGYVQLSPGACLEAGDVVDVTLMDIATDRRMDNAAP